MTLYCECSAPLIDVDHDAGCRRCGRPVDFTPRRPPHAGYMLRDANGIELMGEPDIVLEGMASGTINCSERSRELAAAELRYRRGEN